MQLRRSSSSSSSSEELDERRRVRVEGGLGESKTAEDASLAGAFPFRFRSSFSRIDGLLRVLPHGLFTHCNASSLLTCASGIES